PSFAGAARSRGLRLPSKPAATASGWRAGSKGAGGPGRWVHREELAPILSLSGRGTRSRRQGGGRAKGPRNDPDYRNARALYLSAPNRRNSRVVALTCAIYL